MYLRNKVAQLFFIAVILLVFSMFQSCGFLFNMGRLADCEFEFVSLTDIKLGDIDIEGKKSISEFSFSDYGNMISGYSSGKLNINFNVNLLVTNPNKKDIKLSYLGWKLFIDDKATEVVEGSINKDYLIEGKGGSAEVAIPVTFNLMKVFSNEGKKSLLNFALNMTGGSTQSSRLGIKVQPSFKAVGKTIKYPWIPIAIKYGGN